MKYFRTLPTIVHPDWNGNFVSATNLVTRAYLLPSLQNNVYLYYDYTVKDFDKPESISYKYYNDQYRYWMLLYANNIFDAQAEWPMQFENFILYLKDKYSSDAANASMLPIVYTQSTIHHYEKIVTTFNNVENDKTTITLVVDANTYLNTTQTTQSSALPDGTIVTKQIQKNVVSIYDYELKVNDDKKNIKLIKDVYAIDMENNFSALMSQ